MQTLKTLLLFLLFGMVASVDTNFYVRVIETQKKQAKSYVFPTNAKQFEPKTNEAKFYGRFDFIVVGAGSAGTVIANRLSEVENWNILLLEAGTFENNATNIPSMYTAVRFSKYNWEFVSEPQKYACLGYLNHQCKYPRGKGIGGTTLINNLVYSRGSYVDYDLWATEGNPGWSYKEILPYFIKSENENIFGDPFYHGTGGPLNVEYHEPTNLQMEMFLKAFNEIGWDLIDYNGKHPVGLNRSQLNSVYGERLSTGRAFVNPALNRKNLYVLPESYVFKILINEETKNALGVEFTLNGQIYTALATKETIISAGAINSPQLLMLSGIGPKQHLMTHNIKVIQDLPVGKNFQDHTTFRGLGIETNYTEPQLSLKTQVKQFLDGYGPLTIAGNIVSQGFLQTYLNDTPDYPDIEITLGISPATDELSQKADRYTKETIKDIWQDSDPNRSVNIAINGLHVKSKGFIKLKSRNPFEYPIIDPKLLSNEFDVETIYAGIQIVLKALNTEAFRSIDAKLVSKYKKCLKYGYMSKNYWYCAIRQVTYTDNHPFGTCRMGPDPKKGGVVNSELKVHGVGNLRVADGSILPVSLSGHLSAPIMMIGEKCADMIKTYHMN